MNIFTILKTKSSKDLVERFVANNKNGKITEQEFNNMEEQLKQAKLLPLITKYNSAKLSLQTLRAQKNMRYNGRITGYAPIGYSNVMLNGSYWVMPDENVSYHIIALFSLYSTGRYDIEQIVEFARKLGLVGKISQKPLTKQAVLYILNNPFYCGYARHYGELYGHFYDCIISKNLFIKCQDLLLSRGLIKQHLSFILREAA